MSTPMQKEALKEAFDVLGEQGDNESMAAIVKLRIIFNKTLDQPERTNIAITAFQSLQEDNILENHGIHDVDIVIPDGWGKKEYVICGGCDERLEESSAYYSERGDEYYCGDCYAEYYTSCDACGYELDRENDVHYVGEEELCESCYEDKKEEAPWL